MNYTIIKDGEGKRYKKSGETCYHVETEDKVIEVLDKAMQDRTRIIVDYGDVKTGKSWNEQHDITGRVGRSTGSFKIPLLVYNSRCYGGGGLLDHCIIKIITSKGKRVLYQHSKYIN